MRCGILPPQCPPVFDIADVADPWVVQAPWMSPAEIKANLHAQVQAGIARFFWSSDGGTCWFVRRCTERVADVHLFSKSRRIVHNSREIQRLVWAQTAYQKLEMRTHIRGVWSLAERIGWKCEGKPRASIQMKDGSIVDERLYGILRWQTH
jgi:hypothetical protein